MKISELLKCLSEIKDAEGDLEIVRQAENEAEFFAFDFSPVFDVIQIPDENDNLGAPVVACMCSMDMEDESPKMPARPKFSLHLKRIK